MVDDAGRIDEPSMWRAIERLEAASQATAKSKLPRMDAMREEQVATNPRVDAIKKEQAVTNTLLDAIEREQAAMNARLDILTLRMDRLFYAIIGGTIAVSVSVLIHGFIGS